MVFKKFWMKYKVNIMKTAITLLVIGVVLFMIHNFFFAGVFIKDSSMSPSLEKGHVLLVQRGIAPKRYDIVLFARKGYSAGMSRVIGMPGETISIQDGKIYIDGEMLEEYYGKEPMYSAGIAQQALTLGEDEYFLLGDNRNNCKDSRRKEIGIVKRSQIKGRAIFRIFPLAGVGSLKNQ